MHLGQFDAGTNIGFMVVANGFDQNTGVTTKPTGGPRGGDWVFYTVKHLNPEDGTDELRAHTVLLNDQETGMIVLGMEDIKRDRSGCDHDFNDMVFMVESFPAYAVDIGDFAPMPDPDDSDGDGVLDDNDDFPDDPDQAWELFTPSKTGVGTLAFEDKWPSHGNYDYNDLVMSYQYSRILNSNGKVVEIQARYQLKAHGSLKPVGFGLHLPGLSESIVDEATLTIDGDTVPIGPESGQSDLTYVLFHNVWALTNWNGWCLTYNTMRDCDSGIGPILELSVKFESPQSQSLIGLPPWDPFIYRTFKRGIETHLPNHPPTSKAKMNYFQSEDDDSVASQGRWYLSFCNMPWAMDFPANWEWPVEGKNIMDAYPDFGPWIESVGETNKNWYKVNIQTENLWTR